MVKFDKEIEFDSKVRFGNRADCSSVSKPIRVVHLIYHLGAGGAENGIVNLVNNHDKGKITSAICSFAGQGVLSKRVDKRIQLFDMGKKEGNDFMLPLKLSKFFKQWKPDIVHSHSWGTLCEGIIGAKLAGVSHMVHGEHGTIQGRFHHRVFQNLFWRIPDQILSVSKVHKNRLCQTIPFPIKKIQVIANGVDTQKFRANDKKNQLVYEIIKKKSHGMIFCTVGRMVPVKNQALLIKSFAVVLEKFFDAKLILVGDGPLQGELKNLSASLGVENSVCFLGNRSDIHMILPEIDVYLLTSFSEGMSNTILEAMSCSRPVIATDVGGNSELVVDQETGFLVESDNTKSLADRMIYFAGNPDAAAKMGASGRKRVERHFSIETMTKNYETLYQSLIKEKR